MMGRDVATVFVGLSLAVVLAVAAYVRIVGEQPKPPRLTVVTRAATLAEFGSQMTTDEAQYCRTKGGTPIAGRYCDFGPCGPCQPAAWPCSVRTIICNGACRWA